MNASQRPTLVRYRVLGLCLLLAAITYLDRICIAITAPLMMEDLGLSKVQMSFVFSAFIIAYGAFEIPTGYWGDRVGSRRVLTRIVTWWSAFTLATAGAFNYVSLLVVRFLFGVGEAGAWPNAALTFSRWFPASERGRAQGIFFMGAHLAGGLTPLLVTAMLKSMHWRTVFLVFGCLGFVWAGFWYWWFRDDPSEHKSVNAAERDLVLRGRALHAHHTLDWASFVALFRNPNLGLICLMYFTQSYGFYFFITWLPTYLKEARGIESVQLGLLAGLPLLLSVIADLFGGLSTDAAVRKFGLRWGRASIGILSFVGASGFMLTGVGLKDGTMTAVFIAIAAAFSALPLGAAWGTCVDIGGSRAGMVSAFMNTAGQIGGAFSPIIVSLVLKHFSSWDAPLYLTGVLYGLGGLCWFKIDASKPLWPAPAGPAAEMAAIRAEAEPETT
ncbi:MAG: MFS transporter [Bryobacteraceae bacterium]